MSSLTGFNRPALQALIEAQRARYQTRLPDGDLLLDQGIVPRLPEMDAEAQNAMHAHLDWTAQQGHPLYATGRAVGGWLDEWGRFVGVARKSASKAAGSLDLTGTDGTVVPAGTEFQRSDGVLYVVTEGGSVAAGVLSVTVEADAAGLGGNAAAGATVAIVAAIAGLQSTGVVAAGGLTGGAEPEADGRPGVAEHYRARVLDRVRQPPHGGADFDYVKWAKEVPGVTAAWVYPLEQGSGTVVVRFMMHSTYADGIPQGDGAPNYTGDLKAVYDYIESHVDPLTGLTIGRPTTAESFVVAPVAVPLDVTITGLDPDTPAIRAEIEAELADMTRRRAVPGGTIYRSWIAEAVAIAAGENSHELTVPAASVTHDTGEIAVLGTVTYVDP